MIKQESSGYPEGCVTEDQKQSYLDEYFQVENIQLDRDDIGYNPECELFLHVEFVLE